MLVYVAHLYRTASALSLKCLHHRNADTSQTEMFSDPVKAGVAVAHQLNYTDRQTLTDFQTVGPVK